MSTESSQTDIEKFDRSVWSYLSTISSKLVYAPTKNALSTITKDEKFNDKKPWDFISYYRDPSFDINWDRMNNPATIYGDTVSLQGIPEQPKKVGVKKVQNIPVNLRYDVNLWSSTATNVQSMATALISKLFMTHQVLFVPINPDGENGRFHITDVTWEDNSDIERETSIGKIYRHTISFTVDARITLVNSYIDDQFSEVAKERIPVDIYDD